MVQGLTELARVVYRIEKMGPNWMQVDRAHCMVGGKWVAIQKARGRS